MKKLAAILLLFLIGFSAYAEDGAGLLPLDKLGPDLSTLFGGIGNEILVNMNQITLAGHTFGDAELGRFPRFSIGVPGIGATLFDGVGSVLQNPETVWQFEALPLPDLIESNIGQTDISDIYNATQNIFGLPTIRGNIGFGIAGGFEFLGSGFYLSDELVVSVLDQFMTVPEQLADLDAEMLNLRFDVRKVLMSETGLRPALSVSLGFAHAKTSIAYNLTSLDTFLDEPVDLLGSTLDLYGDLMLNGTSTGFGLDLQLSKSLLYVFVPFLRISTWYHWSSYDVSAAFTATQTNPEETEPFSTFNLDVGAANAANDLSIYLTAGLELKLLFLVVHTSVGANLQGMSFVIGDALSGNFENTDINKVNVNVGFGIQI